LLRKKGEGVCVECNPQLQVERDQTIWAFSLSQQGICNLCGDGVLEIPKHGHMRWVVVQET